MNIILDVLQLRRVKLDYISPPICLALFSGASGSGSSIMMDYTEPSPPCNIAFTGLEGQFLSWGCTNGGCTNVYGSLVRNKLENLSRQVDTTGYTLILECIQENFAYLCREGWYYYTTDDERGNVSDPSRPIEVPPGGDIVLLQILFRPGDTVYNLYKNSTGIANPSNPVTDSMVVNGLEFGSTLFQICSDREYGDVACYQLQSLTGEGPSGIVGDCKKSELGMLPPQPYACRFVPYDSQITVTGGEPLYEWSIIPWPDGVELPEGPDYKNGLPPGLVAYADLYKGIPPNILAHAPFDENALPIIGCATEFGNYAVTVEVASAGYGYIESRVSWQVIGFEPRLIEAPRSLPFIQSLAGVGGAGPWTFEKGQTVDLPVSECNPQEVNAGWPSWIKLDTALGKIWGTPDSSVGVGLYKVLVKVTDANEASCTIPVEISVIAGLDLSGTFPEGTDCSDYAAQLTAYSLLGIASFSKVSGPAWLSVSHSGGVTGTPPYAGVYTTTYSITAAVTDIAGNVDTKVFTFKVRHCLTIAVQQSFNACRGGQAFMHFNDYVHIEHCGDCYGQCAFDLPYQVVLSGLTFNCWMTFDNHSDPWYPILLSIEFASCTVLGAPGGSAVTINGVPGGYYKYQWYYGAPWNTVATFDVIINPDP